MKARSHLTYLIIRILFILSSISHAHGSEIPSDARLLLDKRDLAVRMIDQRIVEELEKLKVAHTKRGALEAANAVVELIKKYETKQDVTNDPLVQIARLKGSWKRDYDGSLCEFDSKGGGVWHGDSFRVTYDPKEDQFEIRSPKWTTQYLRFTGDSNSMSGKNYAQKYKLTRIE